METAANYEFVLLETLIHKNNVTKLPALFF